MKQTTVLVLAPVMCLVAALQPSLGKDIEWVGGSGNWDFTTANWTDGSPQLYVDGDNVSFNGNGDHYAAGSYTVTIDAGGVAPGWVTINSDWDANYITLQGGGISGSCGITVTGSWYQTERTYLVLSGYTTDSLSYSGGTLVRTGQGVNEASKLFFRPAAAGTYGCGSGPITQEMYSVYGFEPTVYGCTNSNDIVIDSGPADLYWERNAVFSGDITMRGDYRLWHPGGNGRELHFTGDFILDDDRTLYGGIRDVPEPYGVVFYGQFIGPTHTLTLDFGINSPDNRAMNVKNTNGFDVGGLVLANSSGDRPHRGLMMHLDDANADFFAGIAANGGTVDIDTGHLDARRGTLNCSIIEGGSNGWITIQQDNSSYIVNLANAALQINTTGGVGTLRIYRSTAAIGEMHGDVMIGSGGTCVLHGQYNSTVEHYDGDLRLQGGSLVQLSNWGIGNMGYLNTWYEFQDHSQRFYLGDGNPATVETITVSGRELSTTGTDTGVFYWSIDDTNVVDDGSVILRYESESGNGVCNFGWTGLKSVQGYSSGLCDYTFRGGSVGTELAPYTNHVNRLGIIGPSSGPVCVVSNATRLVTTGKVGFYNATPSGSWSGHRGDLGQVLVDDGSFVLEAAGLVLADSMVVTNGGSIGGIGTFTCENAIDVYDGSVAPGASAGTLTISSNLVLSADSTLDFELGPAGVVGGGVNDLLVVGGDLTLDGLLNVSDIGGLGKGEYTLIQYTGNLVDNGLESGAMEASGRIDTTTPGEVKLLVLPAGTLIRVS